MRLGTFLSLACLVPTVVFAGSDLDSIVERLQKSYDSTRTIEAKFDQTYRSLRFDEKKTRGEVALSKPGKMRWDYSVPKGRIIVSNGKRITLYDPEDRQALIADQPAEGGLPVSVSFLLGRGKLKDSFKISFKKGRASKEGEVVLECVPIHPESNIIEIDLAVRTEEPVRVVGTKIIDSLGGENEIRFSDLRFNQEIASSRFEFKPPKGTPLVTMPEISNKM
ncbi:MAG: outer membrane lipoprotein carrier protein LolA [Pseudomonadota bacterium]